MSDVVPDPGSPTSVQEGTSRAQPQTRQGGRAGHNLALAIAACATRFLAERDRWFLWLTVLFAIGIGIYFQLPQEPNTVLVAVMLSGILAGHLLIAHRHTNFVWLTAILLTVAAGFAVAKLRTERVRAPILERTIDRATIIGIIEQVEHRTNGGQRIILSIERITQLPASRTPKRIRLIVPHRSKSKRHRHPASRTKVHARLRHGDRIEVEAALRRPPLPVLPRGYDPARAAYFKQIGALGFTKTPIVKLAPTKTGPGNKRQQPPSKTSARSLPGGSPPPCRVNAGPSRPH